MTTVSPKPFAFSSIAALLTVGSLSAQDLLDPLVVTATRSENSLSSVPYTLERLDADFIEDNTRRTLPEALEFTPGVLVQATAYGHGSPFIRGFTGRQNLLLVDGVRINNSTWRGGPVQYWNTIDSYAIDSLELVKSQGSVLYGSDAVGGTLNAFSQSSDFRDQPEGVFFNDGSMYYEYRTNGEGSHVGRLESNFGVGGRYGIHLGLTGKDFGDIEDDAVGRMRNTGYPEQDVDFRFDMALNRNVTLTLAYQYVNQDDVWRWHRTIYNPGWFHGSHIIPSQTGTGFLSEIYDQERSLAYLKLAGVNDEADAFIDAWSVTLSWQKTQDSTSRVQNNGATRNSGIDLNTYGLDISLQSEAGPGTLVYGFDYYVDEADSHAFRNNVFTPTDRPVADDSSYHLFGAYTQYEWRPVEPLTVTGGVRYTYAEAEWDRYRVNTAAPADTGGGNDWDDLSASLRANYELNDCWSIYGGLSQAFRAPNLNDLTGSTISQSFIASFGSPNLDPEKYLTAELGTRYSTGNLSFYLTGFYTWTRDGIAGVRRDTNNDGIPDTSVSQNGDDGFVYGFEAEGAWNFSPCWTLSAMAGWNEGKTDVNGVEEWISRQLPLSGSIALRWTHPDEWLWIQGRLVGAVKEDRISAADQLADNTRIPTNGTPGYLAAMIHAGCRPCENLELTCGIENVFDTDYRIHGSGQNKPGINGILGAKVIW